MKEKVSLDNSRVRTPTVAVSVGHWMINEVTMTGLVASTSACSVMQSQIKVYLRGGPPKLLTEHVP